METHQAAKGLWAKRDRSAEEQGKEQRKEGTEIENKDLSQSKWSQRDEPNRPRALYTDWQIYLSVYDARRDSINTKVV